ncbi:molybdate ABC transporter substrate-binding protein [Mycolicibacter minnesotensis]
MGRTRAMCGAVVIVAAAALSGCGSGPTTPTVTVFAAASLKPAFTEIAEQFRTEHPGIAVDLTFAGSSDLATQLIHGARADVFASANTTQMDRLGQAGLLDGEPKPFASNTLVIVTAPGNPHAVRSFADLAEPGLAVVVCQRPVPCGDATHRVEQATGVAVRPVSEEPDVTDVLSKVTTGAADAGVVYRTDARHAGDKVATVEFAEAAGAVNSYPIALLRDAPRLGPARAFVDLVTGEPGQRVLRAAGFGRP